LLYLYKGVYFNYVFSKIAPILVKDYEPSFAHPILIVFSASLNA